MNTFVLIYEGVGAFYSLRWKISGSLKDKFHIQNLGGNCVVVSQSEWLWVSILYFRLAFGI